jgi:hypothetical protein
MFAAVGISLKSQRELVPPPPLGYQINNLSCKEKNFYYNKINLCTFNSMHVSHFRLAIFMKQILELHSIFSTNDLFQAISVADVVKG